MGIVFSFVDESRHSPWSGLPDEFENQQEHKNQEKLSVFNITRKLIKRTFWINSECGTLGIFRHHHGRDQYWPMIKRSSGRRQKCVSTLIPFFVLDRWKIFQERQKDGKAKLKVLRSLRRTKSQWYSTENRVNSSGQFSQDFCHYLLFARSRTQACDRRLARLISHIWLPTILSHG